MPDYLRFAVIGVCVLTGAVRAENITGSIIIEKRLTRPSITAAVSVYQREAGSPAARAVEDDPLAFERSKVVIWIEGVGPSAPGSASMQQTGRQFSPDLVVITAGSTVQFPNLDAIFHNVFSLSRAKLFDLGNYPKGDTRNVTFGKPGIVYVNCHLHPNMAAAIVVTPNKWFARAARSGQYVIPDVPPGEYRLVAWHKAAGFFRETIQVMPGQGATADFLIPFRAVVPNQPERHP